MVYTVLEIGSGSFKLCQLDKFSFKFQSGLGKNLVGSKLAPESVEIAIKSLMEEVIPCLKNKNIKLSEVLCFATAAVRRAMEDPEASGQKFLDEMAALGFKDIKVFSENDECNYAAYAVISSLPDDHLQRFSILDTGAGSHQLIEVSQKVPCKSKSFPLGSHSDLTSLPNYIYSGFEAVDDLIILGTTGQILTKLTPVINAEDLATELTKIYQNLEKLTIPVRRTYLDKIIAEDSNHIRSLLVDYRLEILPQAIKIIANCIGNLDVKNLSEASQEAIHYVSANGFKEMKLSMRAK